MYEILKHAHSGIMWLVLVMISLGIIVTLLKYVKKEESASPGWYKFYKYTKHLMYLQLLIGIVLLFISPMVNYGKGMMKDDTYRFYGLEHPLMMLIAVAIVSIGLYRGRKKSTEVKKNLTIFLYLVAGLAVMLSMIPWDVVIA